MTCARTGDLGWLSLALVLSSSLGCAAGAEDGSTVTSGWTADSGPAPGAPSTEVCDNGVDDDHDGLFDCNDTDCTGRAHCVGAGPPTVPPGVPPPPAPPAPAACALVTAEATPVFAPVDIVWVVDSSGSMRDEATRVRDNMNSFSGDISASGIDHHVVVMSDPEYVSVPPPLGSDPSRYQFVPQDIDSNEPLERLLSEHWRYAGFLRPEAITHFVVVTDDDSSLGAGSFISQMESRLGHRFTFHAIASPGNELLPCIAGFTGIAAAPGTQYWQLADLTGGLKISVCTPDWSMVFGPLRDAIAASSALPCSYEVPEPPPGMVVDPMRVNVEHTPSGSVAPETLPFVSDPSRCGASGGWYYEGSATERILLCPSSCATVATSTRVDITLGCETLLI